MIIDYTYNNSILSISHRANYILNSLLNASV